MGTGTTKLRSQERHVVIRQLAVSRLRGSEAVLDSSECDSCATDIGARHRQTVPQTAPVIVTV